MGEDCSSLRVCADLWEFVRSFEVAFLDILDPIRPMDDLLERLERHPVLATVPKPQLEWLLKESELQQFTSGTVFGVGSSIDYMMVILEGLMRTYKDQHGQKVELAVWGNETVTGFLPFSRMKTSPVDSEVINPMTVLALHKSKFRDMMCVAPDLTEAMVHVLSDRVRAFTSYHFQNEKLMALGKLSAGLAHELNNPAAAIVRSAGSLRSHLAALIEGAEALSKSSLPEGTLTQISGVVAQALERRSQAMSPLDRSQREEELAEWLACSKVGDAEDIAADFVDIGFTKEDLQPLTSAMMKQMCGTTVNWLRLALNSSRNVMQIEEASRRISDLVSSVKKYTRLDQIQDRQEVDVNEGVRNTLVILNHKIRHNNIVVSEELKEELPVVKGYPGELNQVWTNVIDNALDAMRTGGDLTIRSGYDKNYVTVEVIDNGPGIPEEIQERIFDPFFTTKEIGQGSGVGLDVVQQIIRHHAGKIDVSSVPGRTVFSVCLPIAV
jgi:signal transduction histidine kinase